MYLLHWPLIEVLQRQKYEGFHLKDLRKAIRGSRYLPLKKVYFFVGHQVD